MKHWRDWTWEEIAFWALVAAGAVWIVILGFIVTSVVSSR